MNVYLVHSGEDWDVQEHCASIYSASGGGLLAEGITCRQQGCYLGSLFLLYRVVTKMS